MAAMCRHGGNVLQTRIEEPVKVAERAVRAHANSKVMRFAKSERILHWAIAGPFLASYITALILVLVYNPDRTRPLRLLFSTLHRGSGVALIVLPMLATLKSRGDARIHLYNIKQAWTWMFADFKWLGLMLLAAMTKRVRLPEQGKFHAAGKLNFIVLLVSYPLYVATGILIWITHVNLLAWLLHFFIALLATPLLLGHLYMVLIDPRRRQGLHGMISGYVDRQWAKQNYGRWYRENHDSEAPPQ
jgi:formate dehydrogenase subunit gamma